MAKLSTVPEWVRPPLYAVARVEDFTLRLYERTTSPEVLGAWVALSWLGSPDGGERGGPFGRGAPTHVAAFQALRIADTLAEGNRYPPESWWAARGFEPAARLTVEQWDQQVYDLHARAVAHGMRTALGWLLGELPIEDVELMAPIHAQDGSRIDTANRALYAGRLRELVAPVAAPAPATAG